MKWISVKEKLPESNKSYVVSDGEDISIMGYYGFYKGSPDWDSIGLGSIDVKWWLEALNLPDDPDRCPHCKKLLKEYEGTYFCDKCKKP